jgi:hypothetical protein
MKMLHKILGCSTAAAALALTTTQAQNLLVNGDFENAGGFTANPITVAGIGQGWAAFGATGQNDMSSAAGADVPKSGSFALLEQNGAGNNWNPAGAYQIVGGITAGTTYTFSIWAITDTGSTWGPTPVDLQLSFNDSSGTGGTQTPTGLSPNDGSFSFGTSVANTANGWTQYTVSAIAPAGSQYAMVYAMFMDNGQVATENMFFDNASLVAAPEPTTLALAGLGGAAALSLIRRRKN